MSMVSFSGGAEDEAIQQSRVYDTLAGTEKLLSRWLTP